MITERTGRECTAATTPSYANQTSTFTFFAAHANVEPARLRRTAPKADAMRNHKNIHAQSPRHSFIKQTKTAAKTIERRAANLPGSNKH